MKLPPFDARPIATRHASQNIKFRMGGRWGSPRGHPERISRVNESCAGFGALLVAVGGTEKNFRPSRQRRPGDIYRIAVLEMASGGHGPQEK